MIRAARCFLIVGLLLAACAPRSAATPSNATQPGPTANPPTPTGGIAAEPTVPAAPTPTTDHAAPTQTSLPTPEKPRPRVFVISWDGGGAEMIYNLIDTGKLPNFARLDSAGVRAEYARSVDPTLTAPAQTSIATGSYPSHTGIVSNSYHAITDSIYWYRRGFDQFLDQAEPVWATASRAGLTSAALFFTGGSPAFPNQTADYTIGFGVQDAYSDLLSVSLAPAGPAWEGDLPPSYSPPYEGKFTIRDVAQVYLYVVDGSDDGTSNYDTVLLATGRRATGLSPRLSTGDWGQLTLTTSTHAGADFLLQGIQGDSVPETALIYHSGVFHNTASPRALLEALNEKFGYFPAGHDPYAIEDGWISPEQGLYLAERAALWMAQVTAWVDETYQPDLLFTWQDIFDGAGHSYSLQSPGQYNYTPELAAEYAGYFERSAQVADQALAIMLAPVDLEEVTVMMVADHGMAPIHTRVYVNTILEQAGLLTLDGRDYVVEEKTRAIAFASGGSAHIYINLEDHEMDGFVSPEEYNHIQDQIIDLFTNLTDPESGEAVFQRVLRQDQLADLGLDHPNAGDIFVQANPGYHLDHWRGNNFIFETANFYGQHGYDSSLAQMHAFFIAAGAAVPPGGGLIPPVRIVDYAPTIAALLGFTPAPTVDGQTIPALAP